MKKILFAVVAVIAMCACSGEREYLNYRGMSMGMSAKSMVDSLELQGLALDTAHSTASHFAWVPVVS